MPWVAPPVEEVLPRDCYEVSQCLPNVHNLEFLLSGDVHIDGFLDDEHNVKGCFLQDRVFN